MREVHISADELVTALLSLSEGETVCILDSCGVGHLGSHLLIAGIDPVGVQEISDNDPKVVLSKLDEIASEDRASIFSLSYDLGRKILRIETRNGSSTEPDAFVASFENLIVHDYDTGKIFVVGSEEKTDRIVEKIVAAKSDYEFNESSGSSTVTSNFDRSSYLDAIEKIKERIRDGDTYQTNLTHQLITELPSDLSPQQIFFRLRRDHPAPFAAFVKRSDSIVISASPERFFKVDEKLISTSPIKGTRPRGKNAADDAVLRNDLLASKKDLAENTMIVDLLRNDLGRVCKYGSVTVEKLCDLEEHPTFFHLVSTVSGELRDNVKFSDILTALFPCGSITGAPKISTMKIIDETETAPRGLSMGAIGFSIGSKFQVPSSKSEEPKMKLETWNLKPGTLDLSVAIRTMVVSDNIATFNVGGGIVIDSEPEKEWEETLTKAKALLTALNAR